MEIVRLKKLALLSETAKSSMTSVKSKTTKLQMITNLFKKGNTAQSSIAQTSTTKSKTT